MKRFFLILALALTARAQQIYHLLIVAEPQVQAIRAEFADGGLKMPGGIANLAVPLYRPNDTNFTTVVARWTCLAEKQVTPAMKTTVAQLLQKLPANSFRHVKFTNQVNADALLASLNLTTKRTPIFNQ